MQKLLVAAIAVVVLVLGAAVPALALQTRSWEERRVATESFDAAAETALEASADSATATQRLESARESAEPVLEDARAVAASAPGYVNSAVLDPLVTAVADLEAALAVEAPDGLAMPETERPESVEELRAGVEPLTEWADAETERAAGVLHVADDLSAATQQAQDAVLTLAETVEAEASGALGAAPLATPESRAAVEAARDAVLAAIEDGGDLATPVADYAAAVAAVRASQQAAEAAAAAEAANSSTPRFTFEITDEMRRQMQLITCGSIGYLGAECQALLGR